MDAKTYFAKIREIEQMPYETQLQIGERIKTRLQLEREWYQELVKSAEECIMQLDARNSSQKQA